MRLADANGDARPDIVTGWEEGGKVRICLNPGRERVAKPWSSVTVGEALSVEDAVWVDLGRDGAIDVVSCAEGETQSMFVHWAPREKKRYLQPEAWTTDPFPFSRGMMQWMFCLPLQGDGKHGIDLVAGGKNSGAMLGWWEAPPEPRCLPDWKWHPLRPLGWLIVSASSPEARMNDLKLLEARNRTFIDDSRALHLAVSGDGFFSAHRAVPRPR